jgi:hypothetical protein
VERDEFPPNQIPRLLEDFTPEGWAYSVPSGQKERRKALKSKKICVIWKPDTMAKKGRDLT